MCVLHSGLGASACFIPVAAWSRTRMHGGPVSSLDLCPCSLSLVVFVELDPGCSKSRKNELESDYAGPRQKLEKGGQLQNSLGAQN